MEFKSKLFLVTLLLSALFLSVYANLSREEDPELITCRHQCENQRGWGEDERQKCQRRCERYIKQKREQEKHKRGEGGGSFYQRYGEEEEEFQGGQQRRQHQDQNPYFFQDQHFETKVDTEEGRVKILQKFTERSDLLRGIENFRIGFLAANPLAFVAPTHFDADCVLFVFKGRPTITLVKGEKKESHNLNSGDLFRISAGTPVYMVNRDENEKMFIVKFLKTVSVPGEYEAFYAAGGQDPESFFKAFSPQILQAAFKNDIDKIERLFGQQSQGSIIKASKEQIQKISQQHGNGGIETILPFNTGSSSSSKDSFNLFKKHPSQENKFGRLFEVNSNDFKQLQDFDLHVSFANITRGAMVGPYFNSRATKISFVLDGEGYFEMACPHVGQQQQQQQQGYERSRQQGRQGQQSSPSYQRISGELRRGVVFVAPAGHPITSIASPNGNLQIVCFEVNARDNIKVRLVGKNNAVSQFDKEAKELAFNVPAREVESIFSSQKDEFFFEGPNQQSERGRADA